MRVTVIVELKFMSGLDSAINIVHDELESIADEMRLNSDIDNRKSDLIFGDAKIEIEIQK